LISPPTASGCPDAVFNTETENRREKDGDYSDASRQGRAHAHRANRSRRRHYGAGSAARIEAYEAAGVIKGYKALIDWEKTGRNYVSAEISVKLALGGKMGFDDIAEVLASFEEGGIGLPDERRIRRLDDRLGQDLSGDRHVVASKLSPSRACSRRPPTLCSKSTRNGGR
jgi:hypothetical protein